jgi:hypothetical protein
MGQDQPGVASDPADEPPVEPPTIDRAMHRRGGWVRRTADPTGPRPTGPPSTERPSPATPDDE